MDPRARPSSFWTLWLLAASAGVVVFGLALVLAPGLARRAFGLLLYGDAGRVATFGPEAVAYVSLAHGVLGAVMIGWGAALVLVVRGPFARGEREGWRIVVLSLAAWFVPDTAFSLASGSWPNAALNAALALLFVVPLAATRRDFRSGRP